MAMHACHDPNLDGYDESHCLIALMTIIFLFYQHFNNNSYTHRQHKLASYNLQLHPQSQDIWNPTVVETVSCEHEAEIGPV